MLKKTFSEIFREIKKEEDSVSEKTDELLDEIESTYRNAIFEEAQRWVSGNNIERWLSDQSRGIEFRMGYTNKKNLIRAIKQFFTDFFEIEEESLE